jgi:hypothetical protein
MLYASSDPQNHSQPIDSNAYQPFKLLDSTVVSRISHELDHLSQEDLEGSHGFHSINFSACSSMHSPIRARRRPDKSLVLYGPFSFIAIVPFLTLHSDINRISIGSSTTTVNHVVDPRILILAVSPDLSSSYVPIMNSIFSAQKLVSLLAPYVHNRTFPKTATESYYRCLPGLWSRHRLLTASSTSHRWRLSVPRTTRCSLTVSYRKPLYLKQHLQSSFILFQDDVSPSFIDTQGPSDSHAGQDRFPCSVFLSQEYH